MVKFNRDKLYRGELPTTLRNKVEFEECFKYTPHPFILGMMMNGRERKSFEDLGILP